MALHRPHIIEDCDDSGSSSHQNGASPALLTATENSASLVGRSVREIDSRPVSPLSTMVPLDEEEKTVVSHASDNHCRVGQQTSTKNVIFLNEQQGFLLFIKVYSLYLCHMKKDGSGKHLLLRKFKAVVSKCTTENRRGNHDYTPLKDVVQERLRAELGPLLWAQALDIFRIYCHERCIHVDFSPCT